MVRPGRREVIAHEGSITFTAADRRSPAQAVLPTGFAEVARSTSVATTKWKSGRFDKFQGRQAPVVILSMASSSGASSPRGAGFVFARNRLNVVISRAQHTAFLVLAIELTDVVPGTPTTLAELGAFLGVSRIGGPPAASPATPPKPFEARTKGRKSRGTGPVATARTWRRQTVPNRGKAEANTGVALTANDHDLGTRSSADLAMTEHALVPEARHEGRGGPTLDHRHPGGAYRSLAMAGS